MKKSCTELKNQCNTGALEHNESYSSTRTVLKTMSFFIFFYFLSDIRNVIDIKLFMNIMTVNKS